MADGALHAARCRLVGLRDGRIKDLRDRGQHLRIPDGHDDGISQILVSFNMGRNSDFMQHLGHIRLEILFYIGLFIKIRLDLLHIRMYRTCRFYPTATDSVDLIQNNIPVEGLHNIIIGSEPEGVLCHILAAGRRHHDEGRVVLYLRVVFYFFHDGNSVQSRHDHIHENNIRIRADDHVVRILAIIRLSYYMDPVLFFQNFAK